MSDTRTILGTRSGLVAWCRSGIALTAMIPFRRTGKHRRLKIEDVLSYKSSHDRERKAALDKLAAMSQEFGGYEELGQGPASEHKPK